MPQNVLIHQALNEVNGLERSKEQAERLKSENFGSEVRTSGENLDENSKALAPSQTCKAHQSDPKHWRRSITRTTQQGFATTGGL